MREISLMKKGLSVLLAAVALVGLCGCGEDKKDKADEDRVTVTANTDPAALTGEKLASTAWQSALKEQTDFTVKTVISMKTEDGESVVDTRTTLVYAYDGDKTHFTVNYVAGKESAEAEIYVVKTADGYTLYTRELDEEEWSEWDREDYPASEVEENIKGPSDLTFLKDRFSEVAYSDAEKGYAVTEAGLTVMKEDLCGYVTAILEQSPAGPDCDLEKLVLKFVGGRPAAVLATVAPKAEDEGEELSRAASDKITFTQLYYDYGATTVNLPADLPKE